MPVTWRTNLRAHLTHCRFWITLFIGEIDSWFWVKLNWRKASQNIVLNVNFSPFCKEINKTKLQSNFWRITQPFTIPFLAKLSNSNASSLSVLPNYVWSSIQQFGFKQWTPRVQTIQIRIFMEIWHLFLKSHKPDKISIVFMMFNYPLACVKRRQSQNKWNP